MLLLISASFITINAQDSAVPVLNRGGTTELLYSVTLPYTNFGIKCHHGNQWGVYLHARGNFRLQYQRLFPGFQYASYEDSFTEFLGSLGVSYKAMQFLKPYIGMGAASHLTRTIEVYQPQPAPHVLDNGFYLGGEIGFLLFIFDRVVLDVGFCYVIEPSVNLGLGISF